MRSGDTRRSRIMPGSGGPRDTLINKPFLDRCAMIFQEDVLLVFATEKDAEALCNIQHAAFDSESKMFHGSGPGGPEGYDTVEGLMDLMRRPDLFKIVYDGITVGGLAVVDPGVRCRMVRIFVDPLHQGKGIGSRAFGLLSKQYPNAVAWELDAPSWSLRSHRFYEGLGFVQVGETDAGQ